jgi:hypothetical protein
MTTFHVGLTSICDLDMSEEFNAGRSDGVPEQRYAYSLRRHVSGKEVLFCTKVSVSGDAWKTLAFLASDGIFCG